MPLKKKQTKKKTKKKKKTKNKHHIEILWARFVFQESIQAKAFIFGTKYSCGGVRHLNNFWQKSENTEDELWPKEPCRLLGCLIFIYELLLEKYLNHNFRLWQICTCGVMPLFNISYSIYPPLPPLLAPDYLFILFSIVLFFFFFVSFFIVAQTIIVV